MSKIRAILIDDEQDSMDVLQVLLEKACPEIEILKGCTNADAGVEAIQKLKPDVVFLDIEMPGKNGFTVLEAFKKPDFKVIIITGYEEYALKAIKYSAIDYILKPIDIEELKNSINRLASELQKDDLRIEHFLRVVRSGERDLDRLVLPSNSGFHVIDLDQVVFLQSESGSYTKFVLSPKGKYLASKALTYYEDLLPKSKFHRIHRSVMVNLALIESFDSKSGLVTLKDQSVFEVAHRRRSAFAKAVKTGSLD